MRQKKNQKKQVVDEASDEQILLETVGDFDEHEKRGKKSRESEGSSRRSAMKFSEKDMIKYLWDEKRRLEREVELLQKRLREFQDQEIQRKIESWEGTCQIQLPPELKFDPNFAKAEEDEKSEKRIKRSKKRNAKADDRGSCEEQKK